MGKHYNIIINLSAFALHLVEQSPGLVVVGGSLLDGDETLESEGLAGLLGGLDPEGEPGVLEFALGVSGGLLGDDTSVLVKAELVLGGSALGLLLGAVPDLAAGSTDGDATGHVGLLRGSKVN